jgi:hypothetical protein
LEEEGAAANSETPDEAVNEESATETQGESPDEVSPAASK